MMLALILFLIALAGGATLAWLRMRDRPLPLSLAIGHGVVALAGVGVLIAFIERVDAAPVLSGVALGMFILTVAMGLVLFAFQLTHRPIPVPPILMHAMAALSGLGLLIAAMVGWG